MKRYRNILLSLGLVTGLAGCSRVQAPDDAGDTDSGEPGSPAVLPAPWEDNPNIPRVERPDPNRILAEPLVRAASCADAWTIIREQAIKAMEKRVDEAFASWEAQLLGCWSGAVDADVDADTDADMDGDIDADMGAAGTGESAEAFTTTNNQVEDVDEADFVKNDGAYIYILAHGQLQIIDAWPAADARRIAAYPLAGVPKKLFVHGDRAVIFSSTDIIGSADPGSAEANAWNGAECTYGYDCDFLGDGRKLVVTVLDISDRANPALLRETSYAGSYLSSRRIGNAVYTAVVFPGITVPPTPVIPAELERYRGSCARSDVPYTDDQIAILFERQKLRNALDIARLAIDAAMPVIRDKRYAGDQASETGNLLDGCPDLYVSDSGDASSFVTVSGFDLAANGDLTSTTVASRPGAVYASTGSLYLAMRHRQDQTTGWFFEGGGAAEATTVHKFALQPEAAGVAYAASGVVEGHIFSPFAMDEYEGNLRIATGGQSKATAIAVLAPQEGRLALLGRIANLAPGEDLRSVRFYGGVGFAVTFGQPAPEADQTDPLYTLDLSDPENPAVRGALVIPGFSTYLQRIDASHLITLGYDASLAGEIRGVSLQIIDIGNLAAPVLDYKETIGTIGSSSDAATNHLAFTYFAERDLLAIPVTICQRNLFGAFNLALSGLLVYRVTPDAGFDRLGGVPHAPPATGPKYQEVCGAWWTNPDTQVKRSIFMEDFVYSIALDRIRIAQIDDLAAPVASIALDE